MRMNTKIIAGVIAVIILGVGIYYFVQKKPIDQSMVFNDNKGEMMQTSLKNLIADGKSVWCTFASTQGNTTSSGTVYVADGKMRGDFNSVVSDKTMESHMILRDDTSYVWSAGNKQGVKMSVKELSAATSTSTKQPVGFENSTSYECKPWDASDLSFELPQGITFMDLSSMMPGAGASTGGSAATKAAQCSACKQMTGEQREQCLAMLACPK